MLRALLELRDVDTFHAHLELEKFMNVTNQDERTSEFGAYFNKEYVSRCELWAYCYRLGLKAYHNVDLEALHRVSKHVHLQGRKVHRLDKSIHGLLKLIRVKMRVRLLKLHKVLS